MAALHRFASAGAPPPEALDAVVLAALHAEHLAAVGLELHFEQRGGRVAVEMRRLDGDTVRALSLTEALELL